jgi:hypothetical protein
MYIYALTPIIGMSFPALTPLIFAAAGALGYKVVVDMKERGDINDLLRQQILETTTVQTRLEDTVLDAMDEEVRRGEMLFFEKDNLKLTVMKDERGKLRVQVTGPRGADKRQLEKAGQQFAEELAQLFAQNRMVEELETLNAEVVEEQVNEQGEIVLKVRRWS